MKQHITEEQYDALTDKQKKAAGSYYRRQSEPKKHEFEQFWNIGRMIEYLDEIAFGKLLNSPIQNFQWVDIYGCNLSGTLKEEWCDKLWDKVKMELENEVKNDSFRFR